MNKLKDRRVLCALVLLALLFVQLTMHLNADNLLLDDWVFHEPLESGTSILSFLARRFETWSSRLLIEGALCVTTHSIWAWRVLDSLAMVIMAWALCRLANAEKRPGMLALSGFMVTAIPFAILRSTGWQATSVNYYWTLSCALFGLIPLADALWRRETGRGTAACAVLLALFGANQEQTAAALFGAYLVLGAALLWRERRVRPLLAAILAVAAAELAVHLLCPGNALRARESIQLVNLRDYGQFSLIDKLSIGLTSTTALLFFTYNPLLLGCWAVVAATMLARSRKLSGALTAAAVAGYVPFIGLLEARRLPDDVLHYGQYVLQLGPEGIDRPLRMAVMAMLIALLGLMALSLYLSIGHRPLAAVCVFAFALGFAARMALAFSPTVVESGERTMLPLYGAMMLCALLCVRDCARDGSRRWPVIAAFAVFALLAAANVWGSFALAG